MKQLILNNIKQINNIKPIKLEQAQIHQKLQTTIDWKFRSSTEIFENNQKDCLYKNFQFKNFQHAFDFMTIIGKYSEECQHHPEWRNVYNIVNIELATHDCSGISEKDFYLAQIIDEICQLNPEQMKNLLNE